MTSLIDPVQLRRNLAELDSAALRERVEGGQLTSEAHSIALEILTDRNSAAGLPPKLSVVNRAVPIADRTDTSKVFDRLLAAYVALLIGCAIVIFADPPWVPPHGGGWQGSFGYLAGLVAGLPWTILAAKSVMTGSALSFWTWTALAVVANIAGLLAMRGRGQ